MKFKELIERRCGLLLFFTWFVLAMLINLTPITAIVDKSGAARKLLLILATAAVVTGASLVRFCPKAEPRRYFCFISAGAIVFSIVALISQQARGPDWWHQIATYCIDLPWVGFGIVVKGVAIVSTFLSLGRARLAFITALSCLCYIW